MDQQNLPLVKLLLAKGANPNLVSSGGHSPYHLTYGRRDDNIREELYSRTRPDLRELPDSELDDSEEEEEDETSEEEEVGARPRPGCVCGQPSAGCSNLRVSLQVGYDDIQWNGH